MNESNPAACPSCGSPLAVDGTFCKSCGFDASHSGTDDAHLDGVDLPQGYADEDPYENASRPKAGKKEWIVVIGIFVGLILVAVVAAWFSKRPG